MADIASFLWLKHLRAATTTHVIHQRNGSVVHSGPGAAFWFRPLTSTLSEVPIDDREQPLLFHARTLDYQDITVQATVTYRVAEPAVAATRIDFGIDPERGAWRSTPLEQLGGLLTELAQQHALGLIATLPLPEVLSEGMVKIRERIETRLRTDERLADIGLVVVDVRIVAVRAEADIERALQTPTRERVQQDADKATYERRAVAVELERTIAENELQNQIELARREEQLVLQKGQNDRVRATEQAGANRIQAEADAAIQRVQADATADATRAVGGAEAATEAARVAAYDGVDLGTLIGLAMKELAASLPAIGTLNVTPDLVTQLLSRFTSTAAPSDDRDRR